MACPPFALRIRSNAAPAPFLELLEFIDVRYPSGRGHLVMDNLADHDTDDMFSWFEDHPRWTHHFTPTHASWLNQIEQKFATRQRRVIARGSFTSKQDLRLKHPLISQELLGPPRRET